MMIKFSVAAILLTMSSSTALAQAPTCHSLQDIMTMAVAASPAVMAGEAGVMEREADIVQARSLYHPKLSTFAGAGTGDVGLSNRGVQNQVGLQVTQRLYDFGDARFAREAARGYARQSEYDLEQVKTDAAVEAAMSLLAMGEAREALGITVRRQSYFASQKDTLDQLFDRGEATLAERAEVGARLADANAFYTELQFRAQSAETELRVLTNEAVSPCAMERISTELHAMTGDLSDTRTIVERARLASPRLNALEARADGLRADYERERRNRLPIINLVGTSSYETVGLNQDYEAQDRISVDVSVPLYDGRSAWARAQGANARQQAARSEVASLRRQIDQQAQISFQRVVSLKAQLISRETVEAQTLEQFEAAEFEFDASRRTLPDLIEVRLDYEAAALNRIEVKYQLLRETLNLIALTGLE